jgi:hypothetical protein
MGQLTDTLRATMCDLASVGAAGIEHHGLVAFHRLNQGLGVLELVRVEHQQLEARGPWVGGVHGHCLPGKGVKSVLPRSGARLLPEGSRRPRGC